MEFKDKLRKWTTINPKWCLNVVALAAGYKNIQRVTQHGVNYDKTDDKDFLLERWGARVVFGGGMDQSLYYNAAFFFRFNFPFGVWIGVRLTSNRLFQCGIGYKLSGVLGANFRFQTDESAAAGTSGPNYGQATEFWDGTK